MGAYSNRQFAQSDFDRTGYELNEIEGVFIGTLVCKKYGKKCNIVAYVDFEDGRKIVCTAFQRSNNYLGLGEIEVGSKIELTFKRSKRGVMRLEQVRTA